MNIEYTIHKDVRTGGDRPISLSGDAARDIKRSMVSEGVYSLGYHPKIGITVTKIDES